MAEVLIALTLVAVVLLPVVVGLSQALRSSTQSSVAVAAASIARDKIEQLKCAEFDGVQSEPRETMDWAPGDSFFEVAVEVETVRPDDSAASGLKKAEVTVYRTGGQDPVVVSTTYFIPFGI
jgi:Tfp pilus assembly protein PilV